MAKFKCEACTGNTETPCFLEDPNGSEELPGYCPYDPDTISNWVAIDGEVAEKQDTISLLEQALNLAKKDNLSYTINLLEYALEFAENKQPLSDECAACEDYCKNHCSHRPGK